MTIVTAIVIARMVYARVKGGEGARLEQPPTRAQLADALGVALRMVQLYKQGQNDLAKASAETVFRLVKALGVQSETLL